jgi:hypothetical protein
VEATGKNINIKANAFVNGWLPTSKMYCGDCHTSNNTLIKGPHGSQYNHILKKDYPVTTHTSASTELCFDCHNYNTYAVDTNAKVYSRFDAHIKHVAEKHISCYACHSSHASTTKPHLIVTGRSPGVTTYTETATGGSCTATCHGNESYSFSNYPR